MSKVSEQVTNWLYVGSDLAVYSRLSGVAAVRRRLLKMVGSQANIASHGIVELVLLDLTLNVPSLAEHLQAWRKTTQDSAKIVAFGPHVHAEKLELARQAGIDEVLTRGQCLEQADAWLSRMFS